MLRGPVDVAQKLSQWTAHFPQAFPQTSSRPMKLRTGRAPSDTPRPAVSKGSGTFGRQWAALSRSVRRAVNDWLRAWLSSGDGTDLLAGFWRAVSLPYSLEPLAGSTLDGAAEWDRSGVLLVLSAGYAAVRLLFKCRSSLRSRGRRPTGVAL